MREKPIPVVGREQAKAVLERRAAMAGADWARKPPELARELDALSAGSDVVPLDRALALVRSARRTLPGRGGANRGLAEAEMDLRAVARAWTPVQA